MKPENPYRTFLLSQLDDKQKELLYEVEAEIDANPKRHDKNLDLIRTNPTDVVKRRTRQLKQSSKKTSARRKQERAQRKERAS